MKQCPASIYYLCVPDTFRRTVFRNGEKWVNVDLPYDYVISGEMYEDEISVLGFFNMKMPGTESILPFPKRTKANA